MKNKMVVIVAIMLLVISGALIVATLNRGDQSDTPYLDELDIQTQNPQPAGRNTGD